MVKVVSLDKAPTTDLKVFGSTLVVGWEFWQALGGGLEEAKEEERLTRMGVALNWKADETGRARLRFIEGTTA